VIQLFLFIHLRTQGTFIKNVSLNIK